MRNLGYSGRTCLDSPASKKNMKKPVGLYPCHGQGGNQVIRFDFSSRLPSSWPRPGRRGDGFAVDVLDLTVHLGIDTFICKSF